MDYLLFRTDDFVVNESFQSFHFNLKEEDVIFWKDWIKNHPEKREEIAEAQKFLSVMSTAYQNNPTDKSNGNYQRIREVLVTASAENGYKQKYNSAGDNTWHYWKRLAAVFLLIAISVVAYFYFNTNEPQYIVKTNIGGQKSTIILNDGSKVTLNSESTLRYPEEFNGSTRELVLEGEAFFEVAKDESRPFVVRNGSIKTTALGTSFNISAFPDDSLVQVALVTGSVKVSEYLPGETKEPVFLHPGEAAFYNKSKKSLAKAVFNAKEILSWKEGILYFKDAKFAEIKERLGRWYGVEVETIGKEPQVKHFTGSFENERLVNVLELLSYSRDFRYTISGHKVTIIFNN